MCTGTKLRSASDSFTRPADTLNYADNDLVANSTTAGSVEPLEFSIGTGEGRGIEILGASLQKSGTGVTGATFELHLFSIEPTTTAGDNAAYAFTASPVSGYLGTIVFPTMQAFSDDAHAIVNVGDQTGGINPIRVYLSSSSIIYGLIHCAAAYTDEASGETFTATIIYKQYD